jgi:excisionase family DNA binding protein
MIQIKDIQDYNDNHQIRTVHDLAYYLNLCEAKIYQMARKGQVLAIRIGRSWRFLKNVIDEWIRQETGIQVKVFQ